MPLMPEPATHRLTRPHAPLALDCPACAYRCVFVCILPCEQIPNTRAWVRLSFPGRASGYPKLPSV